MSQLVDSLKATGHFYRNNVYYWSLDLFFFFICYLFSDEMYEILSFLPEDLSFYCRKCFPVGCPEWESTLKRELQLGLESILHALMVTKSAQFILKYKVRTDN